MNKQALLDTMNKLDPEILLECYADATDIDSIHKHFTGVAIKSKVDRLFVYRVYTELMLKKCMKVTGHDGLKDWSCEINENVVGGRCSIRSKTIKIGTWFIENDVTDLDDLKNAILHEIAHANAWIKHKDDGHGQAWVKEALLIGCDGSMRMPRKYVHPSHKVKILPKLDEVNR